MNMVSLLVLVLVMKFGVFHVEGVSVPSGWILGLIVGLLSIVAIFWAVRKSKKESPEMIEAEKLLEAKANA
jgi:hypothetical protein